MIDRAMLRVDRPHLRFPAPSLVAAAMFLMSSALGCSSGAWTWTSSFVSKPSPKTTFVTPAQRIKDLKTLAETKGASAGASAEQVVAQMADQLKSETDPLIREQMVRTLAAFPIPQSVFVLDNALADLEPDVRIACCDVLAGLKYSESQDSLVRTLDKDANVDVRLAAIKALSQFRVQQSVDALAKALDDRDPAVQYAAMESLRQVTGEDFGYRVDAWKMYARGETPPPPEPVSISQRLRSLTPF